MSKFRFPLHYFKYAPGDILDICNIVTDDHKRVTMTSFSSNDHNNVVNSYTTSVQVFNSRGMITLNRELWVVENFWECNKN